MKYLITIFLFISCNTSDPEGMYTCSFEHEFAKVNDTLWLKKVKDNYYKAERHSGITYTNNKNKLITEVWKLELDKNVLTDLKKGRVIVLDDSELIFANRTYRRL